MSTLSLAIAATLGVLTWSLLEYVIHRWLGHDSRFRPNFFESEHTQHHAAGDYFAPSWKKVAAAGAALAVAAPLASLAVAPPLGLSYAAGLAGFYLFYEFVHRRAHTHVGVGRYGRWLRRHHFYHHFANPAANHGVTSPIWDLVFGTYRAPGMIKVPVRMAMPWLVDPSTGDVRSELASWYQLRGRRA